MGNPAYDKLRADELASREQRLKLEKAANEVGDLMVSALKEFLEGKACLLIEPIETGTGRLTVRFSRG